MDIKEIFETYYDHVYGFILFKVRNVHDTEDITSDVFLKVAKNIQRYDEKKASLSTWLITIAVNTIRDFYRGRHDYLSLEYAEDMAAPGDIVENVLANEQAKSLYSALGQLNERQRNVVLLCYYGDMSNKEIAGILNLSVSNVETILSRARAKLKKIIKNCEVSSSGSYKLVEDQERQDQNA